MSENHQPPPTILIVEPDDQVRPALIYNLRKWGYCVIVALNEEDAIERVKNGSFQTDIILLNQMGQSIDQLVDIGRSIRKSAERSPEAPIVIMAEQYGVDLEGQDAQIGESEYVTYLEDGQQLMNLLHNLCPV
ncbi:MAG: hypothetical protein SAK29_26530 [Scytonema sp. PMC 1069.18]|nr:hypothetical protein [Scytonema sp. PMC 1069.18]MEC4883307.1 hypothetical protein [Scytonema sp. PMC 1070.18]